MESFDIPPWSPAVEETVALDHSAFRNCEDVLRAVVSRGDGNISNETYTLSKQWGKILRAKVTSTFRGAPTSSLVMCWSASDPGVEIWIKVDDGT
jgi:hypothetical protein